jgi:hypothetical protein
MEVSLGMRLKLICFKTTLSNTYWFESVLESTQMQVFYSLNHR